MPQCDTFKQDCRDGEKCMPYADYGDFWNLTGCFPIDENPGQPGDGCTVDGSATSGYDDCDIGSMCWDVDPMTNMGVCAALCSETEQNFCNDPGTTCAFIGDALRVCLPMCDPLSPDCPEGQGCYMLGVFGSADWVCSPDRSGELGSYGDDCFYFGSCNPGLVCVDAGSVPDCRGTHCCTEICNTSDGLADLLCDGVIGHQTCYPLYEDDPPPGQENVGICSLPD
jgi:hypothetical protein